MNNSTRRRGEGYTEYVILASIVSVCAVTGLLTAGSGAFRAVADSKRLCVIERGGCSQNVQGDVATREQMRREELRRQWEARQAQLAEQRRNDFTPSDTVAVRPAPSDTVAARPPESTRPEAPSDPTSSNSSNSASQNPFERNSQLESSPTESSTPAEQVDDEPQTFEEFVAMHEEQAGPDEAPPVEKPSLAQRLLGSITSNPLAHSILGPILNWFA